MGLELETDKIIADIDKKFEILKAGEVMEVNNLKPGQINMIREIYSDRGEVTGPVRDEKNYSEGTPRFALYISLKKGAYT